MQVLYRSTRGTDKAYTASEAILKGLSEDGGLFVPDRIPKLDLPLSALAGMTYQETAYEVMRRFLTDFTAEELKQCIENAYDEKFDTPKIAPLVEKNGTFYLELFHGATIAFKDMALSILPHLLTTAAKKNQVKNEIVILTATSGDTGKAALEGFKDVPGVHIMVFYPSHGVSPLQKDQMQKQLGENVKVLGIEGNFDDAQSALKNIFVSDLRDEALEKGVLFSSANSINIGRLLPQVVYYVWIWLSLLRSGSIGSRESFNVVVPTGNFGNILAAWIAKKIGTPIGQMICASNENKVLADFFETGEYNINREFHLTESPSMDILISSNFERFLYYMTGSSDEVLKDMTELRENGVYRVPEEERKKVSGEMIGGWADSDTMRKAISDVYEKYDYLMDPHTAVAYAVYDNLRRSGKVTRHTHTVIISTAHPYKFPGAVSEALGIAAEENPYDTLRSIKKYTGIPIPSQLGELENRKKRFTDVINPENIKESIQEVVDEIVK